MLCLADQIMEGKVSLCSESGCIEAQNQSLQNHCKLLQVMSQKQRSLLTCVLGTTRVQGPDQQPGWLCSPKGIVVPRLLAKTLWQ